jgi:endonuclease/exonuclease/phosphatase family metal-dependent hydrolase
MRSSQTELSGADCPAWALSWSYRRQNLLRELLSYGADILCLQEARAAGDIGRG